MSDAILGETTSAMGEFFTLRRKPLELFPWFVTSLQRKTTSAFQFLANDVTLQIKQSKASRVSRKSRRASKRHPLES